MIRLQQLELGAVHIWRQMIFAVFWPPPSPLIRCFISTALLIKSDLAEPPLPPNHLTSYMDGPQPRIMIYKYCILIRRSEDSTARMWSTKTNDTECIGVLK